MLRPAAALALLALAGSTLAQPGTPAQPQAPAGASTPPGYEAQPVTPPAATPSYPQAQPVSPPRPAPGTPGAASSQQAQPQAAPPQGTGAAPSTSAPPARALSEPSAPIIVERDAGRSPLQIVAIDAAYGALAGALVGVGIALLDQGNNWGRDLTLGAGGGILVGAVVGGVQAYRASDRRGYAMDGLGSPDRDGAAPAPGRRMVLAVGGRF